MRCSFDDCKHSAIANVEWGLYSALPRPHHTADFCEKHLDELWEQCNAPVKAGAMHFVIRKVDAKLSR